MENNSRILFGVEISQEPNSGFLSVSNLQYSYDVARLEYGWMERNIKNIMQTDNFKKIIYKILSNIDIISIDINEFYNLVNDIGISKYLKKLNIYKTTGARDTKHTYCVDWLWRVLYHNLFCNNSLVCVPKFILDIDNYIELTSVISERKNSREISFIEKFLTSSNLITNNHTKQFESNGFKYDLMVDLLGKKFIIEYHEKQHANSFNIENDYKKYVNLKDKFIYIVIPYNKESEQLEFIKEILIGDFDTEELNEIEFFRYKSTIDPKYAIAINEKVFGKHLTGMRNLASSQELKRITKIEQFICQGIGCGMITTEDQILHAIKHTNF